MSPPKSPEKAAAEAKTLATLKKVRESKTVKLKLSRFMRPTFVDLDGSERDFKLRYYQVQGAVHLIALKRMVLGDDTGLGKCVTGGTILTTDRGLIPIWQLAPERDLTPDTFYEPRFPVRVWVRGDWANVRRFYWNGLAPTLKVTTRNGYSIEGTEVHPILVRDVESGEETFVKLGELDPDRHWVCLDRSPRGFSPEEPLIPLVDGFTPNTRRYEWPSSLTPELARLLGYVVGEAWSGHRQFLPITQHRDLNPEVHEDIRSLFERLYGWSGNERSASKDKTISVNSVHIRAHLNACGVDSSLASEKRIPWIIARGTEESARQFLRGLLDCEGSVSREGGFEFSSASRMLVHGVQQLLLRFGVVSSLRKKVVAGRPRVYWRLSFHGDNARLFMERVGLVSDRKIELLNASLERKPNPNLDVVPGLGEFLEGIRDRLGNISRFGNAVRSTLLHVIRGRRNPSYRFLFELKSILEAECLPEVEALDSLLASRLFYDPIATIEEGHAPVMDLEVDHPSHSFVGNGFINHNTIEAISAFTHMMERDPTIKVVIATPKSTVQQWAREIRRFTKGIRPVVIETKTKKKDASPLDQRRVSYRQWADAPTGPEDERVVLILNYALLIRDWNAEGFVPVDAKGKPDPKQPVVPGVLDQATKDVVSGGNLVVFFDEAQAFKNTKTKTWEIVRFLSDRAERAYGLTATLLKSNLMEGFAIYKAIKPTVFPTQSKFIKQFCITQLQQVRGSRRKIPIVVGYRNIELYRDAIKPYFLGRKKQEVSDELPVLVSKNITCPLSKAEDMKYTQALTGILELGDGEIRDFEEHKALVALVYCQKVVDSMTLLKYAEGDEVGEEFDMSTLDMETLRVGTLGTKEQALIDLVCVDGELDGEKVIVYTRFASLVPRLQKILERQKIKSVRITGKDNDKKRDAAQEVFQDPKSDVKVIFITDAGGVGINLQMSRAMVFYDLPWTWGDYIQVLGRMIRIGSPHKGVIVYHLMAERPHGTGRTIDHHVFNLVRSKKDLIDKVLGEAAVGALEISKERNVAELVEALRGDLGQ